MPAYRVLKIAGAEGYDEWKKNNPSGVIQASAADPCPFCKQKTPHKNTLFYDPDTGQAVVTVCEDVEPTLQ
jgi:hypothetical protein